MKRPRREPRIENKPLFWFPAVGVYALGERQTKIHLYTSTKRKRVNQQTVIPA